MTEAPEPHEQRARPDPAAGDHGDPKVPRRLQIERLLVRDRPWATYCIAAVATLGALFVLLLPPDRAHSEQLLMALGVLPDLLVSGQWWRGITGTWLHEDWPHLGVNLIALVFAGRLVEGLYGGHRMWVIYAISAIGGTVGSALTGVSVSVGASGAIFGLLAALLVGGFTLRAQLDGRGRRLLIVIPAAALASTFAVDLFASGASRSGVDVGAHLLGAATGGAVSALQRGSLFVRHGDRQLHEVRSPVHALAAALVALTVTAFGLGADSLSQPVPLEAFRFVAAAGPEGELQVPAGLPIGVWRDEGCEGTQVPPKWAFDTGRTVCLPLPYGGWLIVGRRDRLLTMDEQDIETMREAAAAKRFVRRQPSVMLLPHGANMLYLLLASDGLHNTYAQALRGLLDGAAAATIDQSGVKPPAEDRPQGGDSPQDP